MKSQLTGTGERETGACSNLRALQSRLAGLGSTDDADLTR